MIRFVTLVAAIVFASGGVLTDLSPRQIFYDCQGDWQRGSDLRLGRLAAVIEDDRWMPGLLGGTDAGMMGVITHDGQQFSFARVKTDGAHWYVYSGGEQMGMLSGTTGRILLDTPHGLFQGSCSAL